MSNHLDQVIRRNVELPCDFRNRDQCTVLIGTCEIDKDTEADVGKAGNAHGKVWWCSTAGILSKDAFYMHLI
jgi:hypothetical protein